MRRVAVSWVASVEERRKWGGNRPVRGDERVVQSGSWSMGAGLRCLLPCTSRVGCFEMPDTRLRGQKSHY